MLPRWRAGFGGLVVSIAIYVAVLGGLLFVAGSSASRLGAAALRFADAIVWPTRNTASAPERSGPDRPAAEAAQTHAGSVTLAQGAWYERMRSSQWWERRKAPRRYSPWDPDDDHDDYGLGNDDDALRYGGGFRTVCVRLCDGYYWPISFATTPDNFERDRRKCESSCGSPARLYIGRGAGTGPEEMEDLEGRPYSRLKTAFLYRSQYVESCKCRPDPWTQASADRHRMYALQAAKRKGDKVAAKELDDLKATLKAGTPDRMAATDADRAARTSVRARTETMTADEDSSVGPREADDREAASSPRARDRDRMALGTTSKSRSARAASRMGTWQEWSRGSP
jgi:hypothetical protein